MPDAVQLSFELSRSAVQAADGLHLFIMARIQAAAAPQRQRAPLNLSLVLDRSGSMQGAKLERCKEAAQFVVSHLTADDLLSIVAFDTQVSVLVPQSTVVARDRILAALRPLVTGASTNLSGGWLEGGRQVESARRDGRVSRVLLLTDGQANVGVTDASRLVAIAQGLRAQGVQTTTIGFGSDFAEDLLRAVADAGGGNFHYIQTPEEAPAIFARELDELLDLAAQNLRLRIAPGKGVQLVGVLNDYPTSTGDGWVEVDLGDLLAGDEKRLLVQLVIPADSPVQGGRTARRSPVQGGRPARQSPSGGISVVSLSYQQILGEIALKELSAFVEAPSEGLSSVPVNPVVMREVTLVEAATEMNGAQSEADGGRLNEARERLERTRQRLADSQYASEPDFREQIDQLERLTRWLSSVHDYQTIGRKSLSYSSVSLTRGKSWARGRREARVAAALSARRDIVVVVSSEGPAAEEVASIEARLALQNSLRPQLPTSLQRRVAGLAALLGGATVLTCAIDGGLLAAGVPDLVELNGNIWRGRCPVDASRLAVVAADTRPPGWIQDPLAAWEGGQPRCPCGAALEPDAPLGGDPWHPAIDRAQAVLVLGEVDLALIERASSRRVPIIWMAARNAPPDAIHIDSEGEAAIDRLLTMMYGV